MEKASSEGSAKHHVPVGKDNHPEGSAKHHVPVGNDNHPFYKKKKKGKRDRNEALWDFPSSPEVKNPPCNVGDAVVIAGWENKIPHAGQQLSP